MLIHLKARDNHANVDRLPSYKGLLGIIWKELDNFPVQSFCLPIIYCFQNSAFRRTNSTTYLAHSKLASIMAIWAGVSVISNTVLASVKTYLPNPATQCTATQDFGSSLNLSLSRLNHWSTMSTGGAVPSSKAQSLRDRKMQQNFNKLGATLFVPWRDMVSS